MEYLLKASAVVILFYFCYKLCLQRDTFFEESRWFLLIGLIASITVPFIVIPIYVEQTSLTLDNLLLVKTNSATVSDHSFNFLTIIFNIYLLGVIVFSIKFLVQLSTLYAVIFKNEGNKNGRYTFIKTTNVISPFSFFNYIVYNPNQFNAVELEQIISHEKVHVKQFHTADVLLAQIACIVFWFNPFIWLYNKALKQNLEFIADKTAINYTTCKKSYQYTLLKTSVPTHQLALTNNFYNSLIKKRIVMLHKSKSKKINLLKFTLIIPVLALFLMSFNTKTIIIEKKSTKETIDTPSNIPLQEPYRVIITKDASKEDLDQIIEEAKNKGVTLKFKSIKRNSNNEIIAISASFKNENGSGNYHLKGDEPIISFAYYEDADSSFGFTGIKNKSELNELIFISEDGEKQEINHSDSDANVFVYSSDGKTYSNKEVDKVIIKSKDTFYIKKVNKKSDLNEDVMFIRKIEGTPIKDRVVILKKSKIKKGDSLIWTTNEEDDFISIPKDDKSKKMEKAIKRITKNSDKKIDVSSEYEDDDKIIIHKNNEKAQVKFKSSDGKDPLYIVDGKEISRDDMKDIMPDYIESIEVLKGEKATQKYGDKGKNGVILIFLKKKK